jgi:hypothetical protein
MVKSLITFACKEGGTHDSHGIQKGFRMIPQRRNIILEFLRMGTPNREGVSCWLTGDRPILGVWASRLSEQPCKLRRDAYAFVTYACQWRCNAAVNDLNGYDPPPFIYLLLDYREYLAVSATRGASPQNHVYVRYMSMFVIMFVLVGRWKKTHDATAHLVRLSDI